MTASSSYEPVWLNAVALSHGGHLLAAAMSGRSMVWSHGDERPIATSELPI